jgi:hypothetical protein
MRCVSRRRLRQRALLGHRMVTVHIACDDDVAEHRHRQRTLEVGDDARQLARRIFATVRVGWAFARS